MEKIKVGDFYRNKWYKVKVIYVDDKTVLYEFVEKYNPELDLWEDDIEFLSGTERATYSPKNFLRIFKICNGSTILQPHQCMVDIYKHVGSEIILYHGFFYDPKLYLHPRETSENYVCTIDMRTGRRNR